MKPLIWNNSGWIEETDPELLRTIFDEKLKLSGFGIINFIDYHFEPFGYSAIWLLSESHFALHTFPEESQTYYELSSCVQKQFDKFNSI